MEPFKFLDFDTEKTCSERKSLKVKVETIRIFFFGKQNAPRIVIKQNNQES